MQENRRTTAADEQLDATPSALDIERVASNLIRCVRAAIGAPRGDVWLDITIDGARCLILRPEDVPSVNALSPREREIARMVADGLTNKSMAQVLDISLWTVATHLRRIFAKLGVTSRAAMVARLAPPQVDMPPLRVMCRKPRTDDVPSDRAENTTADAG